MPANTIRVTPEHAPTPESEVYQLRQQFNTLVTNFEDLLAKLDADDGVADGDYAATLGGDNGAKLVKGWSE